LGLLAAGALKNPAGSFDSNVGGYSAVVFGGNKYGTGLLFEVLGVVQNLTGASLQGYVQGAGLGVDSNGKLYWTEPPVSPVTEYQ
jgi:hypothetical protein